MNNEPWYKKEILGLPGVLLGAVIVTFALNYALRTVNEQDYVLAKKQVPEFRSEDLNNNNIPEEFYLIKDSTGKVIDTAYVSVDGKSIKDLVNQR